MKPVFISRLNIFALGWWLTLLFWSPGFSQSADPVAWKESQLLKLQKQLVDSKNNPLPMEELKARIGWLNRWDPGAMSAMPSSQAQLAPKRQEPKLESPQAVKLRNAIADLDDAKAFQQLKVALSEHSSDVACLQTVLRWMDDQPPRRKKYLDEIEQVTIGMIGLLKSSIEERPDEKLQIALDFVRYRRARALAYRELPDVVLVRPIQDQRKLNRQIERAFKELFAGTGQERTEFILLKIRMHRRAGEFGQSLAMLEKYGSTVLPKWYQKKRRDLLKEIGWVHPYREAAAIYARNFPAEVEKERQLRTKQPTTNATRGRVPR